MNHTPQVHSRLSKGCRREDLFAVLSPGLHDKVLLTRAMQYSLGFSFSSPYFSSASTTAKSAVSLVESRMVLYGMFGFRLSAYIRKVPPAGKNDRNIFAMARSVFYSLLFKENSFTHLLLILKNTVTINVLQLRVL